MNFPAPQIAIKQVTDKLILKGINGASQSEIRLSVMQDV
jgi:hypothetical protein